MAHPDANESLTDAELSVLELLADGLSNGQIAERLTVSPHTVRTHVDHVFQKVQVHNRHRLGRIHRRFKALPPHLRAVMESRQPVPEELDAVVGELLNDLDLDSLEHARRIYVATIGRDG